MDFWKTYEKDYKKLMIIPAIIITFFITTIIITKITTGNYFYKDISLKGGTSITYYTNNEIPNIKEWLTRTWGEDTELIRITDALGEFKGYEFRIGREITTQQAINALKELTNKEVTTQDINIGFQGASIAKSFFKDSIIIIVISFIMMGLVIYYYFRSIIPAISITLSTLADVIVVIGMLDLLHVRLSVAGIGAILMLIGYSTDSDVLLANNILRQSGGELMKKLKRSLKTELTMSMAAITTSAIMFTLSTVDVIKSISLILMIGSVSDVLNTWILSAGLQRWYKEMKK